MEKTTASPVILVVDDDPTNLGALGTLLGSRYEVLATLSGAQALRIAVDNPAPDLILLDVQMPEMDGYEVLARLRADATTQDIPVIFVTGRDSAADEERGLGLGAVDYVTKPYRPAIVLARVHTHLELKRARDRLANQNAYLEAEVARRVAENKLILESTAEGILGVDAEGIINFVNPAGLALLGYKDDQLTGRAVEAALRPSQETGTVDTPGHSPIQAARTYGVSTRDKEGLLKRRDGSALSVELSAVPIRKDGKLLGAVASFTDISERKRYLAQLERQSNYDDLTGLPNRNLFSDRLGHAANCSHQRDTTLAVLLIKLYRFKEINDSLGHEAGDRVLAAIAAQLDTLGQDSDTLARLSGDEFAFLAVGGEERASTLAQAILDAIARPVAIDDRELFVSASIGIALCPKDGEDGDRLLRNAGAAMVKARSTGSDSFRFYTTEMNARALDRLELENDLRRAIERGELELHYQPQLNLRNGEIIGCEALLRWRHPQRGMVSPGQFIPLAEETGMIVPIGEWVLRTACRQNKAWQDAGLPAVTMAVNLSAHQFASQDVVALAGEVLRETGVDPCTIELELTESAVMSDAEAFIAATRDLKALCLTLSIDDFGTGFSSLSYLKRFALDRLKIDISFVRDLTRDANCAAIAQAIISLAHDLKLSVIAEGVETEGQLNMLHVRGCDEMQGYYFSPAVPAASFADMLQAGQKISVPSGIDAAASTLLLVDHDPEIVNALTRLLWRDGYRILTADGAAAGLEQLAMTPVAVVIADSRLPEMNGAEFLESIRRLHPECIRIMLSDYSDLKAVTDVMNRGKIFRFVTKPWEDGELRQTLREAFQLYAARKRDHTARAVPAP